MSFSCSSAFWIKTQFLQSHPKSLVLIYLSWPPSNSWVSTKHVAHLCKHAWPAEDTPPEGNNLRTPQTTLTMLLSALFSDLGVRVLEVLGWFCHQLGMHIIESYCNFSSFIYFLVCKRETKMFAKHTAPWGEDAIEVQNRNACVSSLLLEKCLCIWPSHHLMLAEAGGSES